VAAYGFCVRPFRFSCVAGQRILEDPLPYVCVLKKIKVTFCMPGYNSQRRGTARTLPKIFVFFMYYLFCVVLCTVCV
jgi:hypothetical protein